MSFESANPGRAPLEPTESELLERAREAGIVRLKVPTPFAVGPVNCYLIEDDPLTLVDTGPNSGTSLDSLATQLRDHGHAIEDLGLIVLTHQHMDHLGLLDILQRRSGAEVAALDTLAPWLAAFPDSAKDDDRFAQALMRANGVPEDLVTVLGMVAEAFRHYGSSGTVTRILRDGGELRLRDHVYAIHHRPGHSPTDTVLWDEDHRVLIAGDHVLAHISSNATVSRAPEVPWDGTVSPRATPLLQYTASMQQTARMGAELVLGGHGSPIGDPTELIATRVRMHDRRAQKIYRMVLKEPLSAYDIALKMWGNVAVTQAFLTLSEVLGHVDLLIRDGLVHEIDDAGVVRFAVS